MKQLLLIIACAGFASCANNGNGTDNNGADSSSTQTPAVENVNGNIPDTTNTITLNGVPDSARSEKDSMRR